MVKKYETLFLFCVCHGFVQWILLLGRFALVVVCEHLMVLHEQYANKPWRRIGLTVPTTPPGKPIPCLCHPDDHALSTFIAGGFAGNKVLEGAHRSCLGDRCCGSDRHCCALKVCYSKGSDLRKMQVYSATCKIVHFVVSFYLYMST